jgi:hypothetical protein
MESFCSDNLKELAAAMLKVQAEINPAIKDSSNPFAKSRYASLNSVVLASREALLKHGVWLVQFPVPVDPGHLGLMTRLIHASSGEWQASLLVMPLSKIDPQGYGSALTYARRYSLAAMVGLITEDDDAETACGRSKIAVSNTKKEPDVSSSDKAKESSSVAEPDSATETSSDLLSNLPHLDGVNFRAVKDQDGRHYVVATGDTFNKKSSLSGNGFKWNPDKKIWWRYTEAA